MLTDIQGEPDGFTRKSIDRLNEAVLSGDVQRIEEAQYKALLDSVSLLGVVVNYLTLERAGCHFDFGSSTIKKGTVLYRVRDYKEGTNYSHPSAWGAPPMRNRGRANHQGEESLYVASQEFICLLETHTAPGAKYALARYECTRDITVGGFTKGSQSNALHDMAGLILNAFLIAPSRSERNSDLFDYLDGHYGRIRLEDLCGLDPARERGGLELPFKFAVMNQRDQLHEMTNELCDVLKKSNPCGIRYSSCYVPMETAGITSNAFNLALYRDGIDKLRFIDSEIKVCGSKFTCVDIVKCLVEGDTDGN